jgi:hypothetical protein
MADNDHPANGSYDATVASSEGPTAAVATATAATAAVAGADAANPAAPSATPVELPQFDNPLKRLIVPAILLAVLGVPLAWGIVSFFQDTARMRDNYNSIFQQPIYIAQPNFVPQTSVPAIPQPSFQPTVTQPRRHGPR